jgi:hypothetical protein
VLATHELPEQALTETLVVGQTAQVLLQRRAPVLHVSAQVVPLQLVVPFAEVGQGMHDVVPQELTLVFAEHAPLQM